MHDSEVRRHIERTIIEQLGIAPEDLSDDASFIGDLGADPLDVRQILSDLEETFGFQLGEHECKNLASVHSLIACVQDKLRRFA